MFVHLSLIVNIYFNYEFRQHTIIDLAVPMTCHSRNHRYFKISIQLLQRSQNIIYIHGIFKITLIMGPPLYHLISLCNKEAHLFLHYKFFSMSITGFECNLFSLWCHLLFHAVKFYSEKKSLSVTTMPKGLMTQKVSK